MPESEVQQLAEYLKHRVNVKLKVLAAMEVPSAAKDLQRTQLIAQELIQGIRRAQPERARDPKAYLIGLTAGDIYTTNENWGFAFSIHEGRIGVVATARMDPVSYGKASDPNLLRTRLRKMVMKRIGGMVYEMPGSNDRRSVMYTPILGLEDLDSAGESFLDSDVANARGS